MHFVAVRPVGGGQNGEEWWTREGGVTGCELGRRENVRSALREMSQRKDGAVARGEVTVCKREGL